MPKRAPSGTRKTLGSIGRFIAANGIERAAELMGISPGYARRVSNAVKKGKPLSSVVKTKRGLGRWVNRLSGARAGKRAQDAARKIDESGLPRKDIARESESTRVKLNRDLARMRRGELRDPKRIKEIEQAAQRVARYEPAKTKLGLLEYPSPQRLSEDSPGAMPISRPFSHIEDIRNWWGEIGKRSEYFVIVHEPDDTYRVYDIRTDEERMGRKR